MDERSESIFFEDDSLPAEILVYIEYVLPCFWKCIYRRNVGTHKGGARTRFARSLVHPLDLGKSLTAT